MFIKEHQQLLNKYKAENKPTKHEKEVSDILNELGVRFIPQKGFLSGCYVCLIVDFYIPKKKLIIEVDGEYHKDRESVDKGRDLFFAEERGMKTLRITNEDIDNSITIVKERLKLFLDT